MAMSGAKYPEHLKNIPKISEKWERRIKICHHHGPVETRLMWQRVRIWNNESETTKQKTIVKRGV